MVKAARSSKKFDLQKRCMFDEDWTQIEDINEHINTHYNMDVQFATSAPPRSRTRKAAKEVSQRLNKMQQIWDEARDRILAEEQGLYRAIDTFRQANRARKHWYLSGNILGRPTRLFWQDAVC